MVSFENKKEEDADAGPFKVSNQSSDNVLKWVNFAK